MIDKYKYYSFHVDEEGKKIIAVTHYAGHVVRGIAKCAPEDVFDVELGCKIAVARAEKKVAKAKIRNATSKFRIAAAEVDASLMRYEKMKQYYIDAIDQLDEAGEILDNLLRA